MDLDEQTKQQVIKDAIALLRNQGYTVTRARRKKPVGRVGPTFVASFADGETVRMSTFTSLQKLDLDRGVRLAQAAWRTRKRAWIGQAIKAASDAIERERNENELRADADKRPLGPLLKWRDHLTALWLDGSKTGSDFAHDSPIISAHFEERDGHVLQCFEQEELNR